MDKIMTKQDSYVERRQLFKNIWETAMNIDDKEEIMNKPKVIKTLRLDEVDKYPIGKTKNQRIRNLRHVCNKILEFCDRQDADDKFYEQMANENPVAQKPKSDFKQKKIKVIRTRKKITKAKSLFSPRKVTLARVTTSDGKDDFTKTFNKMSRPTSPIKFKRTLKLKTTPPSKLVKLKQSPERFRIANKCKMNDIFGEPTVARRKAMKKKLIKRKKKTDIDVIHTAATTELQNTESQAVK